MWSLLCESAQWATEYPCFKQLKKFKFMRCFPLLFLVFFYWRNSRTGFSVNRQTSLCSKSTYDEVLTCYWTSVALRGCHLSGVVYTNCSFHAYRWNLWSQYCSVELFLHTECLNWSWYWPGQYSISTSDAIFLTTSVSFFGFLICTPNTIIYVSFSPSRTSLLNEFSFRNAQWLRSKSILVFLAPDKTYRLDLPISANEESIRVSWRRLFRTLPPKTQTGSMSAPVVGQSCWKLPVFVS